MILRRVTGVLVALLLFHLTWVGDVSACDDIVVHPTAEDVPASNGHAGHGGAHETGSPVPSGETQVDRCCAAMASCTVVLVPIDGNESVESSDVAGAARSAVRREPTSGLPAPEPPPPRA